MRGRTLVLGWGLSGFRCARGFLGLLTITGNSLDGDKLNELHISGSGGDCDSTAYCGVAPAGPGMGLGLESGSGLGLD